jgi:hypothetical protein
VSAAITFDETIALAMTSALQITTTTTRKLTARGRITDFIFVLFTRGAWSTLHALVRSIATRDDRVRTIASNVGGAGGTFLSRPTCANDQSTSSLHFAAARSHRGAINDAALVRIVFTAADESIAVASRHDTWTCLTERGGLRITATMHADRNLFACLRAIQTIAKRLLRIGFGHPPIDARARIAELRGVMRMRARRDTGTSLRDLRQRGRIGGRRWLRRRFRRRLLPAARNDDKKRP